MNYENDINIDESALDVEWLEQPKLLIRYARHAAEKAQELDLAKENLDLVRAEVDMQIRDEPEQFGISVKLTEALIGNTIISEPKYKIALKRYNTAKYEHEIARAAVSAIHMRKEALENLVRLHGMQYFAGPKMPRDLSEEKARRAEQQKSVDAGIAQKFKRKRQ